MSCAALHGVLSVLLNATATSINGSAHRGSTMVTNRYDH